MTNWKEKAEGGDKTKSKKGKASAEWKKVENVTNCINSLKKSSADKRKNQPGGTVVHIRARRRATSTPTGKDGVEKPKSTGDGVEKPTVDTKQAPETNTQPDRAPTVAKGSTSTPVVHRPETFQIPKDSSQHDDDSTSLRSTICLGIQNAFRLACGEDGQIKISVDNIFPLLKALGLNPQSEQVVDLVREASIETYGDIDLADFENVVLSMVKEQDETIWAKRLEEKDRLHHEAEAKKAKLEAARLKLEQERKNAGFEEEEEEKDEWKEYEREKEEVAKKVETELKEDELYDNLKMAFRFIDADDDGVISTQDLYTLMMGLGEMMTDDELFGMLNMADVDCDGKVTFDDFRKFLIPKSGDESLILSPAALASQLIQAVQSPEVNQTDTDTPEDGPVTDNTQDVLCNTQQEENNDSEVTPVPEPPEPEVKELTPEEKARIKRRSSMLYGYIALTKSSTSSNRQSTSSVTSADDDVFQDNNTPKTPLTPPTPVIKEDVIAEEEEQKEDNQEATNEQDNAGHLDAIREEDEHSNYETDVTKDASKIEASSNKTEQRVLSAVENKRKLFSRQSSSASLKTKITDSFCDSGFDTMDSVNCSEIRDEPDVFDVYDEELIMKDDNKSPPESAVHQTTPRGLFGDNDDDDEDMVDPLHVQESLSRVSSLESLAELEKDLSSDQRLPIVKSNDYDRVRNFVNEHMYLEISPDSQRDESEFVEQTHGSRRVPKESRIEAVSHLEQAILKRSKTGPLMTVYTSRTERPQSAKPSVNGIPCSHIDIDLRCESPPKADIKSYKQFTDRVNSARSSRRIHQSNDTDRRMSIVDLSNDKMITSDINSHFNRQKWPSRPLTRPRSPFSRRTYLIPDEKLSFDLETHEIRRTGSASSRQVNRRAQSATPMRRSASPSLSLTGIGQKPERPKTAQLPYTKSRNENNPKRDALVVQPLSNADELYPNKTKLTTYHHGFKSIWPIGRKINLIQTKKPFKAFEMNSYSRAIERNQFPFKGDHNITFNSPSFVESSKECQNETLVIGEKKNVINLEMGTEHVKKTTVRKLSLYISTNCTPRAVR